MVRNMAVKADKKNRRIKAAVKTARRIRHPKKSWGLLQETPLKKWLAWSVDFNMRKATIW